MSVQEATNVYIETTIPAGMTMAEYRRSRPRRRRRWLFSF